MRLGDLDALKEDLKQYFSDGVLDSVSAKIAFNMILRKIDNAPTVEITEEQAIDKLHETGWLIRHDKEMTERPHIIDNCDMNIFEPEKMIQTPSCLTNPERHEELLERYKEGEYGES